MVNHRGRPSLVRYAVQQEKQNALVRALFPYRAQLDEWCEAIRPCREIRARTTGMKDKFASQCERPFRDRDDFAGDGSVSAADRACLERT